MSKLDSLTYRQLWQNIMHYRIGEFDRMPVIHWQTWIQTMERWYDEGLPKEVVLQERSTQRDYFNAVPQWQSIGVNLDLYPLFDKRVEQETDEYTIFWGGDGVLQKDLKHTEAVPHYMDFSFKTADDWPAYKKRLLPDEGRIQKCLARDIEQAELSTNPVYIDAGSLMGWLRNWMGVENMCYMMLDSPETFTDYVDTVSDLVCWQIDLIIPKMKIKPDLAHGWEDIAGSSGPFINPDFFDEHVAPGYRKIRDKLDQYGIHFYSVDSDGKIESLIGNWMKAGVNIMFPIEPGTWHCTPEAMRAKFGKELLIQGGFDKLALERGRDAIDAEIEKHIPLMKQGGFVMMPDHLITPGVPLEDYKYYIERIRKLRF